MASTAITNLPTWFTRWPGVPTPGRRSFYLAARPAFPAALAPSFEKAASKRCSSSGVIVRRPSSSFDRSLWWSPTSAQNRTPLIPSACRRARIEVPCDGAGFGGDDGGAAAAVRRGRSGFCSNTRDRKRPGRLDERHRCRGELLGGGLDILERLVAGAELLGLGHAAGASSAPCGRP